jgi:hypothetical protein
MANCENAAMETVQAASTNRAINGTPGITHAIRQLPDRDNAVLPLRYIRQRFSFSQGVRLPFSPHTGEKDRRTFVSPLPSLFFAPRHRSTRTKKPPPEGGGFGEAVALRS